jgi:hypothetical protein
VLTPVLFAILGILVCIEVLSVAVEYAPAPKRLAFIFERPGHVISFSILCVRLEVVAACLVA